MKLGDLVVIKTNSPEFFPEKIGIFLGEGYTNKSHTSYWVYTNFGIMEVSSFMLYPIKS